MARAVSAIVTATLGASYRRGAGLLAALVALACVDPAVAQQQAFVARWQVSEFQPDVAQGGRANSFAVNPTNNAIVFVTSESGGLFRSSSGGARWAHVDSLPSFRTSSVAFAPGNPETLIATTLDDFKTVSGGGIWRSTDGGETWTQPALGAGAGSYGRPNGYDISVAPDGREIFVGMEHGVAMSVDDGATWIVRNVFAPESTSLRVYSVAALGNGRVIVGGPRGLRISSDNGTTWVAPATSVGEVEDIHALGRSPLSALQAFVAVGTQRLFHTEDGGNTWTQIASAPPGKDDCGGIAFVRVTRRNAVAGTSFTSALHVYYGNRCALARLTAPIDLVGRTATFTGAWQGVSVDHGDPRDLAFDSSGKPLLLATDGGLHRASSGGKSWTYTGGGRNGFNALQITEVQGQLIDDMGRHDLYFGTQDNDLWSSSDRGSTWVWGKDAEGFFIELQRRVQTSAHSQMTFVACGGCAKYFAKPLFGEVSDWRNPPGDPDSAPMILRRSMHIQGVDAAGGFTKGLAVTTDLGATWRQFAAFPEERRDLPKLARPGSSREASIVYQAYRAPGAAPPDMEINHLLRIRKNPFLRGPGSVSYPAMTNFGGLGINPTMFAWYQVFAVDPGDPDHVIAPDILNGRAMRTRDGGDTWTEISELTGLATDGGRLRFSSLMFPIITAIKFSPQNPRLVLAGTSEGGLYSSSDGGTNWSRIPRSERVTYVTGFHWLTANDVIVATYGRGLWRLQNRLSVTAPDWIAVCHRPCMVRAPYDRDRGDPAPDERSILVYDGRIVDAREEGGVLRQLLVSPGATVVTRGGDADGLPSLGVEYGSRPLEGGGALAAFRSPKPGWIMKGVVLDARNTVAGAAYGDGPITLSAMAPDLERAGTGVSPAAERPYISLSTKGSAGAPSVTPGGLFEVSGRNFTAGSQLEILIDGTARRERITVDSNGRFQTVVRAPRGKGLHKLEVRDGERVLDGSMFLVKHADTSRR